MISKARMWRLSLSRDLGFWAARRGWLSCAMPSSVLEIVRRATGVTCAPRQAVRVNESGRLFGVSFAAYNSVEMLLIQVQVFYY
jgi:hypothetical protein